MKYIVFGDTGGHFNQLHRALIEIGLNPKNNKLPEDTTIIHVGDLIHKGPHSDEVIELVDTLRKIPGNNWIQISGNHEQNYLSSTTFWEQRISDKSVRTLQKWKNEGFLKHAALIPTLSILSPKNGSTSVLTQPTIITHAGLSPEFIHHSYPDFKWVDSPQEQMIQAVQIVEKVNSLPSEDITFPGTLLGHALGFDKPVGPVWAHGVREVWNPWRKQGYPPFNQIVGHTSPYMFDHYRWYETSHPPDFTRLAIRDWNNRTLRIEEDEHTFIFVDPGFTEECPVETQPYLTIIKKE